MPPALHAKSILPAQAALGEGALWNPETAQLYWVDIEDRALHVFNPATGEDRRYPTGKRIGTVVPMRTGHALVALRALPPALPVVGAAVLPARKDQNTGRLHAGEKSFATFFIADDEQPTRAEGRFGI